MKIKAYKCKCGHEDFFFADKGNQKGIYCSYCGKWLKWADKDEQNLAMKKNEAIPKEQYEAKLKADIAALLEELKAEFEVMPCHVHRTKIGPVAVLSKEEIENAIQEKIDKLKE